MIATIPSRGAMRLVRVVILSCAAVLVAACPSDGPTDPGPNPGPSPTPAAVQTVTVSPASSTIATGETKQLSATLKDASGNLLTGRTVTWASSSTAVATVNSSGLVTAVAVGGPVTITATSEGKSGTAQLTVAAPAAAVETVSVAPASSTITTGETKQLSATLKDASGNVLTDRTVTWASSSTAVATVSSSGLVTAVAAGGPVTITATSEGKSGTAEVTVGNPVASRVAITPRFAGMVVDSTRSFEATAHDESGSPIVGATVTWSSTAEGVATLNSSGVATGVSPGVASITAQVDAAVDTAWVAVVAGNGLLSTAFAGGEVKMDLKPGQTVAVPVRLDLSRVSSNGDLGSVQFDLTYDPAVLVYDTAQAGVSGSATFHVPTAGTFKYSFAGTDVQGSGTVTLVTVTFTVAAGAQVGTQGLLELEYTEAPSSTSFEAYTSPIAVPGRIRIVAP